MGKHSVILEIESKCCKAKIEERQLDSHYAYAPYTNRFFCSKCFRDIDAEEILGILNERNNRN